MSSAHPLVEEILSGQSFELRVLAAQGILPLPLSELIEIQVVLTRDEDRFIAESARSSLAAVEVRVILPLLVSEASEDVLRYFALERGDAQLVEVIVGRRDVPRSLLLELAPRLTADLQEALLQRQDAIVEVPALLDALESNPRLSTFARRRVLEYREHLVPRVAPAAAAMAVSSAELFREEANLSDEDVEEIERVLALPAAGEVDRRSGLSEHQIKALPVPVRIKLSRGASRTLRGILIRDLNTNVALSTLINSAFSMDELEQLAASRSVIDEVLAVIAKRREWVSRYGICLNLVKNPRVPVATALRLLPRLGVRDLRTMSRDRNVADAVRNASERLYKIKVS